MASLKASTSQTAAVLAPAGGSGSGAVGYWSLKWRLSSENSPMFHGWHGVACMWRGMHVAWRGVHVAWRGVHLTRRAVHHILELVGVVEDVVARGEAAQLLRLTQRARLHLIRVGVRGRGRVRARVRIPARSWKSVTSLCR